jgi:hypothetical protein
MFHTTLIIIIPCTQVRHPPLIKIKKSLPHARATKIQKSKNPPLDPLDYCGSCLFITDGLTPRPKPLGLDPIRLALARFGQIRSLAVLLQKLHALHF